ncbi:MAG: hypothetical protein WA364_04620 [Candidatus Nitrosopolaris sp.]
MIIHESQEFLLEDYYVTPSSSRLEPSREARALPAAHRPKMEHTKALYDSKRLEGLSYPNVLPDSPENSFLATVLSFTFGASLLDLIIKLLGVAV